MELTNEFRVGVPVERAWAVLTDVELIAPCMPGAQLLEVEGEAYRGVVKVKVGPITAQYRGEATFLERDEQARVAVLRAEGREIRGQGNASATVTARLVSEGSVTVVTVTTDLTVTGRVAQFGRGVMGDVSAKLLAQFADCLQSRVLAGQAEGVEEPPVPVADGAEGPGSSEASSDVGGSEGTAVADAADPATVPDGADAAGGSDAAGAVLPEGAGAVVPGVTGGSGEAGAAADRPAVRRVDSPEPEPVDLVGTAGAPLARRVGPVVAALAFLWFLRRLLRRR